MINDTGADELQVTFEWKGRSEPQLVGDFNNWGGSDPFAPGAPLALGETEPGVWTCTLALPRDAYIEYAYLVHGRRTMDPLNPKAVSNGMGASNNFLYMPDAAPTRLAQRARGVLRGTVTRYTLVAGDVLVGEKRTVWLYQPPVTEPCPLVVVLDGRDYLRRVKLPTMVDNLIAQGRIQPVALAMVDDGGSARYIEYACSEATVNFLTEFLLPFAREKLRLQDAPSPGGGTVTAPHGILGASMGGVMSLYAAVRAPEVFGKVLSQSGAFRAIGRDFVIFELIKQSNPKPISIWMDAGRYDLLLDHNRRMYELLVSKGYRMSYREYNGGHNYPAWRDDVWRGLEYQYGPTS